MDSKPSTANASSARRVSSGEGGAADGEGVSGAEWMEGLGEGAVSRSYRKLIILIQ